MVSKSPCNSTKGFTLVELSIVLVIIGLLAGGLLVARSMIETARINSLIADVTQFDIAIGAFHEKFGGVPGDSPLFNPLGNNDGKIQGNLKFTGEVANFWPSLQQGGFNYKNKTFSSTVPASGFDIESNTPDSPAIFASIKAGVIVESEYGFYTDNFTTKGFFYNIADWSGKDPSVDYMNNTGKPIAKPGFVFAIDQKIDDGQPASGYVMNALNLGSGTTNYSGCDNYNGSNTDTAKYLIDKNTVSCYISISAMSRVGQADEVPTHLEFGS